MKKDQFVYVTYIRTTPEKLWNALIEPEFTRQFWFIILQQFGLQAAAPQLADICFVDWWQHAFWSG